MNPRSGPCRGTRRGLDAPANNDTRPSRYAGIKHILACVDGTDKDRSVLDQALQIALRSGSHIDVLHVRFDVHGTTSDRYERQIDRLLDKPVEHIVAEAAARARRHFEEWHAQCNAVARPWDGGAQPLEPMAGLPVMRMASSRDSAASAI